MTAEDELAIRNLVARYDDAVCRRDADAWVGSWAEDCRWDLGPDRVADGRDAVLKLWLASIERYPWIVQLPVSGSVAVDGDGATGWWYLLTLNRLDDGAGMLNAVHYRDRYVRTPGGWRFAERVGTVLYRGGMDPGVIGTLTGP